MVLGKTRDKPRALVLELVMFGTDVLVPTYRFDFSDPRAIGVDAKGSSISPLFFWKSFARSSFNDSFRLRAGSNFSAVQPSPAAMAELDFDLLFWH